MEQRTIAPISLKAFTHYNEILKEMSKPKPRFDIIELSEDGGRKSAKTTQTIKFAVAATLLYPNQCDVELFRWLKGEDADELFEEVIDNTQELLGRELTRQELNRSKRRIRIAGTNNKITIRGINTPNKRKRVKMVGAKRAKGKKYLIKVFEEAYEFSNEEILGINNALGGYNYVIDIKLTNPHSLAYPYIKNLDNEFKHNKHELMTKGEQFKFLTKLIEVEGREPITMWRIIHYTNWRVNSWLSQADIMLIMQSHNYGVSKGLVADYGMPATEDGAIYGLEYDKIIQGLSVRDILVRYGIKGLTGGIDVGDGDEENSSSTTAYLVGKGLKGETLVLKEYYQHNARRPITPKQKASEIVDMYLNAVRTHQELRDYVNQEQVLQVWCEWDFSFIELLKLAALERKVENWLQFEQTSKLGERTRINVRKYKIMSNRYVVSNECIEHLQELQIQRWSETRKDKHGLPVQEDADNHTTDAIDYAECEDTYEVIDEDAYKLVNKNDKARSKKHQPHYDDDLEEDWEDWN